MALAVPVVGVGASAGGLEAFGLLLGGLPDDTGMAFVLIQHLAPEHDSLLPEILGRRTALPIHEAVDGVRLEPNHVYVVAPGTEILLVEDHLSVIPRDSKATVDRFFSSLAHERQERAIGVVLSGTGSDGTAGAVAIHEQGGLVIAQDPGTCSQDGMPVSAIGSGVVDLVLPPEDIGRELARIARHPFVKSPLPPEAPSVDLREDDPGFERLLQSLVAGTGVSFADYRRSTILRRSMRRMAVNSIDDLDHYAEFVRAHPEEARALFSDVLIHVTRFFRDPDSFEVLKRSVLPELIDRRSPEGGLKIWVPGCSSGEEAYSIAIVCSEVFESRGSALPYQVFATDLDGAQITRARASRFPATIASDVSPERLKRWFVRTPEGYQVAPEIREHCVFARHNLLEDPPFSRTDLVSCRNVMIYFGTAAHRKLIPIFHYALNPGGFLMLGTSEGIGRFGNLFEVADEKHRIFRKRDSGSHARPLGTEREPARPPAVVPGAREAGPAAVHRRIDEFLARRFAPPAVVITSELAILHVRGDTSPYLTPAPGAASLNVLRMVRPGLEAGLRNAIHQAKLLGHTVRVEGLSVRDGAESRTVNVEVDPASVSDGDDHLLVVLFEEATPASGPLKRLAAKAGGPKDARTKHSRRASNARRIAELERELAAARLQFQGIVADRNDANERLQVMHEEALSANEELQSINEELATAKEELQSTNEELNTLNDELRDRNLELTRLGEELSHLLAGVGAPVIEVDAALVVRRVSPGAEDVFRRHPPRVGSPLIDDASSFEFSRVESELRQVMELGAPSTLRMSRTDGRRFLVRVQPNRRSDGMNDGAVLVIVDVEDLEQRVAERTSELQASNEQMVMFSYSVSHDLRAPVRAMRGYAEAIMDEAGPQLGHQRRQYCMQIIEAAGRLDALILSLLALSRIRSIELPVEPLRLHALVSESLTAQREEIESRNAEVEVAVPESLPPVSAHPETLSQVIQSLLSNAVKFVRPGQRPHVRIHAEVRPDFVRLWVEDDGIGIRAEHHARIFGVFERLHSGQEYPGVGIGLAFAKHAMTRMNGAIGLESVEGSGSRFWIDVPAAASRGQEAAQTGASRSPEISAGR